MSLIENPVAFFAPESGIAVYSSARYAEQSALTGGVIVPAMHVRPVVHNNYHVSNFGTTSDGDFRADYREVSNAFPANVFSSLCSDGLHRPVLDIDKPAYDAKSSAYWYASGKTWNDMPGLCEWLTTTYGLKDIRYWESSTKDNYHLISSTAMTWEWYELLLHKLYLLNIIQSGYMRVSRERKMTMLRLPGVKK